VTDEERNELIAEVQGLYMPPPPEPEFEEIERLTARIAELEAKGRATRAAIGWLDVLACTDSDAIWWEFGGVRFDRAIDAVDAVISAIETPVSGERRGGGVMSYYSDPESEVRDLREQVAELEAKLRGGKVTDRIVQTTWIDAGPHQPLPPPDDPHGDEIERLTARIAELEAMLERCVRLVVETGTAPNNGTPPDYWVGRGKCYPSDYEAEAAIRAAIETPDPRP
jgi:hypothetical protein